MTHTTEHIDGNAAKGLVYLRIQLVVVGTSARRFARNVQCHRQGVARHKHGAHVQVVPCPSAAPECIALRTQQKNGECIRSGSRSSGRRRSSVPDFEKKQQRESVHAVVRSLSKHEYTRAHTPC
jgi:hypothetical protein